MINYILIDFRPKEDQDHLEEDLKEANFLQYSYENLLRKKESRLTRISISIVWLFIICHIWKLIPTIYELLYSPVSPLILMIFFVIFCKVSLQEPQ